MTGAPTFQDFITQTMGAFVSIPKRGQIYVAIASLLSAISDLVGWNSGDNPANWEYALAEYALAVVVILMWLAAEYATTVAMVQRPLSVVGFVKFTAVIILTFVPLLICLGVVFSAVHAGFDNGVAASTFFVLLLFGFLLAALLPAWPLAQAMSKRFISPMRIFKATNGYRWSLIFLVLATGSVNKLVPGMSSASNLGEAIGLALCDGVVTAAILVLTASITVTAWKFAVRRDASLAPV